MVERTATGSGIGLSKCRVVVKNRINLCFISMLIVSGCSMKNTRICESENNKHVDGCEQIVNEAYIYALLSVNSYEVEENTPVILPENIREVRHEDSHVSKPAPKYVDSNVYDNGSFQAKVFEIKADGNDGRADTPLEVVIAYRGTEIFPIADLVDGTITHNHRIKAVRLYDEIKKNMLVKMRASA